MSTPLDKRGAGGDDAETEESYSLFAFFDDFPQQVRPSALNFICRKSTLPPKGEGEEDEDGAE